MADLLQQRGAQTKLRLLLLLPRPHLLLLAPGAPSPLRSRPTLRLVHAAWRRLGGSSVRGCIGRFRSLLRNCARRGTVG
jgi:hypothetical protein